MKIIHILSPVVFTGSEAYASTLCTIHERMGHENVIVADKLHINFAGTFIKLPISDRSFSTARANKIALKKIIAEQKPDVIHCHSRAGYKIAFKVCKGTSVPVVSTIHGRQHLHFSSRNIDVTGDSVIAICKNVQTHLINELNVDSKKISILPNLFDFSGIKSDKVNPGKKIISIIGRTNSIKGERVSKLFECCATYLLEDDENLIFRFIGGSIENFSKETQEVIKRLNSQFGNRIENIEYTDKLYDYIAESSVVIGAGRVAIETAYLGVPLIAMGESLFVGLINESNYEYAVESNFGDISAELNTKEFNNDAVLNDVKSALDGYKAPDLRKKIEAFYGLENVAIAILEVYKTAKMKKIFPGHIPTLMYHRVSPAEVGSRHNIYVTPETMDSHLKLFKRLNYTTITFKDYKDFREGLRPISEFPKNPIVLTFDDGYEDNYDNLFPLLKKYGNKAVIFILGDRTITNNAWDENKGETSFPLMNSLQIQEMAEYGVEFGAHTMSHADLIETPKQELDYQIKTCKSRIEKEIGREVCTFSYPYGKHDNYIKEYVKQAGYYLGISTDSGGLHFEDDLFEVFRVQIFPGQGLLTILKKSMPSYRLRYFKKRGK